MQARRLRQPRVALAFTAAVVSFGVLSSSVGTGALPASTLPVYGVTNGYGSRATVAELGDVNGDGRNDIAMGAPAAGAPSKADGGAVYVAFGSSHPQSLASAQLFSSGYTNNPSAPATPSAYGSRYDAFGAGAHTGMSLAALPDVNGDGYRDIAVGSPDTSIHRPGEGNVAVLYGKPQGVHINLSDLWENG